MSVEGDMLYYSIDHPDPDNNFTVTVIPINRAGLGEDAVIMFVFLQVDQDGYPLQSEGRTPGDEDSSGVDGDHSEVTDWSCTCKD